MCLAHYSHRGINHYDLRYLLTDCSHNLAMRYQNERFYERFAGSRKICVCVCVYDSD